MGKLLGMRKYGNRWWILKVCIVVGLCLAFGSSLYKWASESDDDDRYQVNFHSHTFGSGLQDGSNDHVRKHAKQTGVVTSELLDVLDDTGASTITAAIDLLNSKFGALPVSQQPAEILKWAARVLPRRRWAQVTSFGLSGLVITDILVKEKLLRQAEVITIDTLHLFPETYELIDKAKAHYHLDRLKVYRCKHASSRKEFETKYGPKLYHGDPLLYDFVSKIEPMKRALNDLKIVAWITGRRKSQGGERQFLKLFEVDKGDGRLKMNPLAYWSREDVWEYVIRNQIPYNKLHDQGYFSVGDEMSTSKAAPDMGERAGRWLGENRTECGIHHSQQAETLEGMMKHAERVRAGYVWEQGALRRAKDAGITQVTEENFEEEVVKSSKHILFEVYAPWCPHCRNLEPQFNALAHFLREKEKTRDPNSWTNLGPIKLARMDGYQNKIPARWSKMIQFDSYPSIYLVYRGMQIKPSRYLEKSHEPEDMDRWIRFEINRMERVRADLASLQ